MRRICRLFAGGWLALLLALQPAHAQRARPWGAGITGQVTLAPEAEATWIPFVRAPSGLVTIRAMVNGQPVLALVDTGSPYTAIDARFAQAQGIRLRRTVSARKGQVDVFVGEIAELRVGPLTQTGGRLAAIDLSATARLLGMPLTMVLGADYLRHMAVEFDFDRERLRLRPSGAQRPEGVTVPLAVTSSGNRFTVAMTVGSVMLDRVLIDTGSDATLNVTPAAWNRLPLAGARITSAHSNNLYGPAIWPLARFGGVSIGPAMIPDRIDILASQGRILDTRADALIGIDALRYFNLFLDAAAGKMILSPRATPHHAAPPSAIGILGHGSEQGFLVEHVMKGSPAAEAGITDGDTVCTVNGASIAHGTPGSRENWAARPVGTTLALGLCSGRSVTVTLVEFY